MTATLTPVTEITIALTGAGKSAGRQRYPSFNSVGFRLRRAEALSVAHLRPGIGLDTGQNLAQVVGVVVDPLVEKLV